MSHDWRLLTRIGYTGVLAYDGAEAISVAFGQGSEDRGLSFDASLGGWQESVELRSHSAHISRVMGCQGKIFMSMLGGELVSLIIALAGSILPWISPTDVFRAPKHARPTHGEKMLLYYPLHRRS